MRVSTRFITSVLLASVLAWGQQPQIKEWAFVLVRMSFTSTWVSDFGDKDFPQICFSVDHTGRYQMRRLTTNWVRQKKGNSELLEGTPHTELLQGTLPPMELTKLEKLLGDREFRQLTSSAPTILKEGGETFVAEVPRENGVQRIVMSDADRENPFPRSADRIVNWLQHFKAQGAEPLDVSAQDICPSGALQPVNPATALLQPISSSRACVTR
jgi:hypothetical protein